MITLIFERNFFFRLEIDRYQAGFNNSCLDNSLGVFIFDRNPLAFDAIFHGLAAHLDEEPG